MLKTVKNRVLRVLRLRHPPVHNASPLESPPSFISIVVEVLRAPYVVVPISGVLSVYCRPRL